MYAYIDETGNTGKDIFNIEQPLFITAALITKTNFDLLYRQDIKKISEKIGHDELHANDLGIGKIEQIAEELLEIFKQCDANFIISCVEKRYLVITKFVDTLFDPSENKAVPPHVYYLRYSRLFLTYKIATNLNENIAKKFWSSLIEKNKFRSHALFLESLDDLDKDILKLSDNSLKQLINDAIQWVKQHTESISVYGNKAVRSGHLPNMVAFSILLGGIEQRSKTWDRTVIEIVHDRQNEFEKTLKEWHDIHKNFPDKVVTVMGKFPLRYCEWSQFRMSSSTDSAGIQAIDVVIWLYKRHFLDKKPLGNNSGRLLDYVFSKAEHSYFSLNSIQNELQNCFDTKKPPTDDDLRKAKEFLNIEEEFRQKEMLKYNQAM